MSTDDVITPQDVATMILEAQRRASTAEHDRDLYAGLLAEAVSLIAGCLTIGSPLTWSDWVERASNALSKP